MANTLSFRKKIVINRGLQFAVMISMLALADLVVYLDLFVKDFFDDPFRVYGGFISSVGLYALILVAVLVGSVVGSLYLTNRIAGPIYHLKQHMNKVIGGNFSEKLEFRKGDYFDDLIEPYQKIVQRLAELEKQKK